MSEITIIDNEFVTLWYHPDTKIVHHQFHQFLHGDPFRETLNTGTELLKKYGAQKWLSDNRKNTALSKEDTDWGKTDWFPRTVEAGWKYWAIVQPEQVLGKMNMKRLAKTYSEQGVTTEFFSDPDEAMAWLEKQ